MNSRDLRFLWIALGILLGAFFPVRMATETLFRPQPAPILDYGALIPVVAPIAEGTYDWRNFFQDTYFVNTHPIPILILIQAAIVQVFQWDLRAEIAVGIILGIIRTWLLFDIVRHRLTHPLRWLALPLFAGLNLGASSLSIYEYGINTITWNLNYTGLVIITWSFFRITLGWRSLAVVITGGWLASFSLANGALIWPLIGVGMIWKRYRSPLAYLSVLLAAGFGMIYPIYFRFLNPVATRNAIEGGQFNPLLLLIYLGEVFAPSFDFIDTDPLIIGGLPAAAGLLALIAIPYILWKTRDQAATLIVGYTLMTATLFAVSRNFVAPWYTLNSALLWSGIMLGAITLLHTQRDAFAIVLVSFVTAAGIFANLNLQNKSYYWQQYAPQANTCFLDPNMTHDGCVATVNGTNEFFTVETLSSYREQLTDHRWMLFRSSTTALTLQGAYNSPYVRPVYSEDGRSPEWQQNGVTTAYSRRASSSLYIPDGAAVIWTVALPDNAADIQLKGPIETTVQIDNEIISLDPAVDLNDRVGDVLTLTFEGETELSDVILEIQHLPEQPLQFPRLNPADFVPPPTDQDYTFQDQTFEVSLSGDVNEVGAQIAFNDLELCLGHHAFLVYDLQMEALNKNLTLERRWIETHFQFADGSRALQVTPLPSLNVQRATVIDLKLLDALPTQVVETVLIEIHVPYRVRGSFENIRMITRPEGRTPICPE